MSKTKSEFTSLEELQEEFADDPETFAFIKAYEEGEFDEVPDDPELKKMLQQAAKRHMQKHSRINLRIPPRDLTGIKQRAAQEGIPYQTLITSLVHKYITGRLVDVSTVQQLVNAGFAAPPATPYNPT